jgi:hypothetical protein
MNFILKIITKIIGLNPSVSDGPKIYVSIVSHNEQPGDGPAPGYPDFVANPYTFVQHKRAIVRFAQMLRGRGVTLNFQSDWNFLEAMLLYDRGRITNNKNLLRYLREDLGHEVDPHAHETQYNYADVAELMASLDVPKSAIKVVGGFIAKPVEDSMVEYLNNNINGIVFDSSWIPQTLWGAGTKHHIDERDLWLSGIWCPANNDNFDTHDGTKIPYIGSFNPSFAGLERLLGMLRRDELESNKVYTQTISVGQSYMLNRTFLRDFISEIDRYRRQPSIQWVGLSKLIDIWKDEYNSQPNMLR